MSTSSRMEARSTGVTRGGSRPGRLRRRRLVPARGLVLMVVMNASSSCATMTGAAVGGLTGAAIVGHGEVPGEGIAIGAAVGLVVDIVYLLPYMFRQSFPCLIPVSPSCAER